MLKKIIKRIFRSIFLIFFVITLSFYIIHSLPHNFYDEDLEENLKKEIIKMYNLDKPIGYRYKEYIKKIATFDLGKSIKYESREVKDVIKKNFPVSLELGIRVLFLSTFFSYFMVVISFKNKSLEKIFDFFSKILVSIPSFIMIGLIQIYIVYVHNKYFGFHMSIYGFDSEIKKILPVLSLLLLYVPIFYRLIKNRVSIEMEKEYVKFAFFKRFSTEYIIRKHILINIISSLLSSMIPYFISLITGSFVIENLYGIAGLGKYYTSSIIDRDYPMIMGLTIFYTIIIIIFFTILEFLIIVFEKKIKVIENE